MQAQDLDEALERAERFAAAGADILFIDALESADEMRRLSELRGAGAGTPKMASMLEGGGKTPMLTRAELANMNFKIVAYPLSLLGVSVRAMQRALVVRELRSITWDYMRSRNCYHRAGVTFPTLEEHPKRCSILCADSGRVLRK